MGIEYGGHINVDGKDIPVGSPEFESVLPISADLIAEVEGNDNISHVTTALAMAVLKLEIECRNLRQDLDER